MRVLVVARDAGVVQQVRRGLRGEASVVYLRPSPGLVEAAARLDPDLVVLDLASTTAGWELVPRLLAWREVPLVVLLAGHQAEDRIEALERGADDCLASPFNPEELGARIRAVMRRCRPPALAHGPLRLGQVCLDPRRGEAYVRGAPLHLRPHEFALLLLLAYSPGVVFSRPRLVQLTRGAGPRAARPESYDVYISRLRRKLVSSGLAIQAVRGVGYRLVMLPSG